MIMNMKNKILSVILLLLILLTAFTYFIEKSNKWGSQSNLNSSRLYFLEKKIDTIDSICLSYSESEGIAEIHNEIKQIQLLVKQLRSTNN